MSSDALVDVVELEERATSSRVAEAQAKHNSAWTRMTLAFGRMEKSERRVLIGILVASISVLAFMLVGLHLAIQDYLIKV